EVVAAVLAARAGAAGPAAESDAESGVHVVDHDLGRKRGTENKSRKHAATQHLPQNRTAIRGNRANDADHESLRRITKAAGNTPSSAISSHEPSAPLLQPPSPPPLPVLPEDAADNVKLSGVG